jgi:hypothetical protein
MADTWAAHVWTDGQRGPLATLSNTKTASFELIHPIYGLILKAGGADRIRTIRLPLRLHGRSRREVSPASLAGVKAMTSTSPAFARLPEPADNHVALCSLISDLGFCKIAHLLDLYYFQLLVRRSMVRSISSTRLSK